MLKVTIFVKIIFLIKIFFNALESHFNRQPKFVCNLLSNKQATELMSFCCVKKAFVYIIILNTEVKISVLNLK